MPGLMIDLAAEYDNRARVPDHPSILEGWARDAAAYRAARPDARLDLPYGESPRSRYDFFPAPEPRADAPVALFIHGGYWQAFDKSFFSHMAAGANAHGVAVAVMSYDLCPAVHLGDIIDQAIACARRLRAETGRPILPFGHSAGGHLAACLAGANWPWLGEPEPIIAAAMPISGLFHLSPLLQTPVNDKLRIDVGSASRMSPLVWTPRRGLKVTAVVGAEESSEYLRQTRALVEAWSPLGVDMREIVAAGANHFTVIGPLADPTSALTRALMDLTA